MRIPSGVRPWRAAGVVLVCVAAAGAPAVEIPWRSGAETVDGWRADKSVAADRHLVLVFAKPPAADALAGLGVDVLHDGGRIVGARVAAGADLAALPGLEWAGPVPPEAKGLPPAYLLADEGRYVVEFFPGVAPERQDAVIAAAGARPLAAGLLPFVRAVEAGPDAAWALAGAEETVLLSRTHLSGAELATAGYCPGVWMGAGYWPQYLDDAADKAVPTRLDLYFGAGTDRIAGTLENDEAVRAMDQWRKVLRVESAIQNLAARAFTSDIVYRSAAATAQIPVSDGRYNVLAYTFFPTNHDMHMDAAEFWAVQPASSVDGHDVYSVALHELGHALDIRTHLTDANAIMAATYNGSRDTLHHADIAYIHGITTLDKGLVVLPNTVQWEGGAPPVPGQRRQMTFSISNRSTDVYNNVRVALWCHDRKFADMGVRSGGFVTIPQIGANATVAVPAGLFVSVDPEASTNPTLGRDMAVLLFADEVRMQSGFTFTLGAGTADDAFEPNDSLGAAAPLTLGDHHGLALLDGNEDWFRVAVAPGETLRAGINCNEDGMRLVCEVLDGAGNVLATGGFGNLVQHSVPHSGAAPADYFVRVRQGVTGAVTGNDYRLQVSLVGGAQAAPPAPPEVVRAVPAPNAVTLYWSPVPGATGYRVHYSDVPRYAPPYTAETQAQVLSGETLGTQTHVHLAGLRNNLQYEFTVEAVNAAGAGLQAWDTVATPRPDTVAPDGAEPDNAPGLATALVPGVGVAGRSLQPPGFGSDTPDEDWFTFTLAEASGVRLTVTGASEPLAIRLYDAALELVDATGFGGGSSLDRLDCAQALAPGTYHASVSIADVNSTGVADYGVLLETAPCASAPPTDGFAVY